MFFASVQGFEPWQIVLEAIMLPLHHTDIFADETGFEPVQLRLQRNALPLELFVRLFATGLLTDILFPHDRIRLCQTMLRRV